MRKRIRKIEAYLWHDLIAEGNEILAEPEKTDPEDFSQNFEPYAFQDPEFASLIRDFCLKSEELDTLADACHGCVTAKAMSLQYPFYQQDVEYPLALDHLRVFEILHNQNSEKFTGIKSMIFQMTKTRVNAETEEARIKRAIKDGFWNMGRKKTQDEDRTTGEGQDAMRRQDTATKTEVIQQLIESTQRESEVDDKAIQQGFGTSKLEEVNVPGGEYKINIWTVSQFSSLLHALSQ